MRGQRKFGFFGCPRVFWFSNRNQKTHGVFGFPTEIQKTQGFLVFHQRPNKKTKIPCVFCFPPKIQFGFLLEKPKTPRKTKKNKSFGPLTKVLDFWICGFWFPPKALQNQKSKNPKIQKSKTFLRVPKLLDLLVFLGFFWFLLIRAAHKGFGFSDFCFFGFPRRNV